MRRPSAIKPLQAHALARFPGPSARRASLEVVEADRDVPVARAELIGAAVVVERQLEHRLPVADREEVVGRLELAVADDVHVALKAEAERLVERAVLLGIRDPFMLCRNRATGASSGLAIP